MSEKQQRTAASMREKMISRYGDGLSHKHNKLHLAYRHHCKSHPVKTSSPEESMQAINCSTGALREFGIRKIRKRLDQRRIH